MNRFVSTSFECLKCGVKYDKTIGDTCPSKVHTGSIINDTEFYSTGEKGGYYTEVQKWSCCGALHNPPCSTTYGPHDFKNRLFDSNGVEIFSKEECIIN